MKPQGMIKHIQFKSFMQFINKSISSLFRYLNYNRNVTDDLFTLTIEYHISS